MTDVLLPPDIQPETEDVELVDDGTQLFIPQFAQGAVQAAQYFEPYVKVTQTFKGLRQSDRARIMAMLGRLKGQYNTLRALVGYSLRGSFPATELFTNNTFANGTTGWSTTYGTSIVQDRVLVNYPLGGGTGGNFYQSVSLNAYSSYTLRSAIYDGAQGGQIAGRKLQDVGGIVSSDYATSTVRGLGHVELTAATSGAANQYPLAWGTASGYTGQASLLVPWCSLSRCALVDNGPSYLTYSDTLDNAAWTKTRCSVSANATIAPDGTSTADSIIEDSSTNTHTVQQIGVTISSNVSDYCATIALKAGSRTWAVVAVIENTAATSMYAYINLSTGAIGTVTGGSNLTNVRAFSTPLGNGWYTLTIVGRKINSATSLTVNIYPAIADGTVSYAGNGSGNVYAWRATLASSSVPIRLTQTTSATTIGAQQTGNAFYVKGLPVSTNGLLCQGDPFEINGELKICTAALNSDAAGLGYLQFAPALFRSPSDNDPVIIGNPFGKFKLAEAPKWSNRYGQYADLTLVMRAIYE